MNGLMIDIYIICMLYLQSTKIEILSVIYSSKTFFNYLTYLLIKTEGSI